LPFATAIDASLRRRPTGLVRPHFLTPDLHRLSGLWRWQGAVDDAMVPIGVNFRCIENLFSRRLLNTMPCQ